MASSVTPTAKRPRIAISNAQKRALRTWFYAPGPKKTLAEASAWWFSKYGYALSSSTGSDILSNKHQHLDSDSVNLKAKTSRTAKWDTLEKALSDWAIHFDQANGMVSGDLIRTKATKLWEAIPEYQGLECPKWSNGWLDGFKGRFNFHRRRKAGEAASIQITEDILIQMDKIREIKAQFSAANTYNMDETGYYWKRLPSSGLTRSSSGKKLDKTRITANMCCNEDGSDKVPIWFIGTARRPRCFAQNHIKNPENKGFFWRWNSTAWMTYEIMIEWLRWFDNRVGRPVLLLMDNFGAHELGEFLIQESGQPLKWTRIEWFPANTTAIFQPCDQGIIQNWKCYVKKQFLEFLVSEFDAGRDYTQTHHVLRAIEWGIQAWDIVKPTTIAKCWEKGFKTPEEMPENSHWNESLELIQDLQVLAKAVLQYSDESQELDVRTFIDPPDERVIDSDEEITNRIIAHYSLSEHDEDGDIGIEVESVKKVSLSEAIMALNTLKLFEEQRDQLASQDLMQQLRRELRVLESERINSQRQSNLFNWLSKD
jgi:DDE superfamily endonuclease/Fission yeast centromere protein N-terminal domain/Tc5 transposase DNA-binding domain